MLGWDDEEKAKFARVLTEEEKTILRDVIFEDCNISGSEFRDIDMRNMQIQGSDFWGGKVIACDLRGTKINQSKIDNFTFKECDLRGVEFDSSTLSNIHFHSCNLTGLEIKNAEDLGTLRITDCICREEEVEKFKSLANSEETLLFQTDVPLKATRGDPVEVDRVPPTSIPWVQDHCPWFRRKDLRKLTFSVKYHWPRFIACDFTGATFRNCNFHLPEFREIYESRG